MKRNEPEATALREWRERMKLTQREAAEALSLALATYQQQERGVSWKTGVAVEVPLTTLLAAAALEHRPPLKPISKQDKQPVPLPAKKKK